MAVDLTNGSNKLYTSSKTQLYEQQILCKNNCGYYGNSIQWRGYCSICYRKLVVNANLTTITATAETTNQKIENGIAIVTVDKKESPNSKQQQIWNEAKNFTKFSSKNRKSSSFNIFKRSSSQMSNLNSSSESFSSNENTTQSLNLKTDDIEQIKQTFPSIYQEISKKIRIFLDKFNESIRKNELNNNEKIYQQVQDFYASINTYLVNNKLLKVYYEKYLPNQTLHLSPPDSKSIQYSDEIDKLIETLMIYVERNITHDIYDQVFPLIMSEFEEQDIQIQKRIRSFHWINKEMIGTCLDESSILFRDYYEEALSHIVEMDAKRTPYDKMMCITECSKCIYKAINLSATRTASADDYLPALTFIVLKANPTLLYSNTNFIAKFAYEKHALSGEHAYHFCSLNVVIAHIESLNASHLNMSPELFDKYCRGLTNGNQGIKLIDKNIRVLTELSDRTNNLRNNVSQLKQQMSQFYENFNSQVINCVLNNDVKYHGNFNMPTSKSSEIVNGLDDSLVDTSTLPEPLKPFVILNDDNNNPSEST